MLASTQWLTEYLAYTTFRMMITKSSQNLQYEPLIAFQVGLSMLGLNVFLVPFITHSMASIINILFISQLIKNFFLDDFPLKIKAAFLSHLLVFPVQ